MGAYYSEWQGYVPDPIPTTYDGKDYPSRRRALRAKREQGDTSSPSLRKKHLLPKG